MNFQLKAGAGSAEIIFPEEMFPLEGFCCVHDAPHIRVLVLECGERVAIASIEIVNLFGDGTELVRKIIAEKCGTSFENIWLHTTHAITTPHPPRIGEKLPPHMQIPNAEVIREMYFSAVSKAAEKAAEQASVLSYARMGYGAGFSDVNINRDVETPFGWWIGFNPEGFSNKTLHIVKLEKTSGELIAILVNYGLKPCAIDNSEMQSGNRQVTSDLPGLSCSLVEEKLGAPCLYIMSAAGDQVPKEMALFERVREDGTIEKVDLGVEKGFEIVSKYGTVLAENILETSDAIVCDCCQTPIRCASREIICMAKGRSKMQPTKCASFTAEKEVALGTEVIAIGDVALVAVKPEVNAITESQLREASPFDTTLVFSMTNGDMKYMPDKASFEHVTWEAQSAMLMEGTAEAWVEAAVAALNELC